MTTPHPQRRDEILDAAERRFVAHGYLATSVASLIADTGIAKGTFYHHFASKEEVMVAVIDRHLERLCSVVEAMAERSDLTAVERLVALLGGDQGRPDDAGLSHELERDGNELMRLRALNATVVALTPPVARILADGVARGELRLADPEATAAAFLAVTGQLVDRDILGWVHERDEPRLRGLLAAAEQLLGAAPGALAPLADHLGHGN